MQDWGRKTPCSDTGLHFSLVRGQSSPLRGWDPTTPQSRQLVPAFTLWEIITKTLLTLIGKQKKGRKVKRGILYSAGSSWRKERKWGFFLVSQSLSV